MIYIYTRRRIIDNFLGSAGGNSRSNFEHIRLRLKLNVQIVYSYGYVLLAVALSVNTSNIE